GDPPHLGAMGDHHPLRAPNDPVRLHRGLLQPPPPPPPPRRPHPRRGLRCQPGSLIYRNPVSIRSGYLQSSPSYGVPRHKRSGQVKVRRRIRSVSRCSSTASARASNVSSSTGRGEVPHSAAITAGSSKSP